MSRCRPDPPSWLQLWRSSISSLLSLPTVVPGCTVCLLKSEPGASVFGCAAQRNHYPTFKIHDIICPALFMPAWIHSFIISSVCLFSVMTSVKPVDTSSAPHKTSLLFSTFSSFVQSAVFSYSRHIKRASFLITKDTHSALLMPGCATALV